MNNMRKTCAKLGVTLLLLACLLAAMTGSAFAATAGVTATIEVKQVFQVQNGYTAGAGQECPYKFWSLDPANPMPSGLNANGELEFTLDGNASKTISIDFTHAGEYHYMVKSAVVKAYENYYYDESVYSVDVYAENAFEVPTTLPPGSLHNLLTVFLDPTNGKGGILNVVNGTGGSSTIANPSTPVTVVDYP